VTAGVFGESTCTSDRKPGCVGGTKKDRGVCALLAPAKLGLKETAFRLRSGSFASNGETTE